MGLVSRSTSTVPRLSVDGQGEHRMNCEVVGLADEGLPYWANHDGALRYRISDEAGKFLSMGIESTSYIVQTLFVLSLGLRELLLFARTGRYTLPCQTENSKSRVEHRVHENIFGGLYGGCLQELVDFLGDYDSG